MRTGNLYKLFSTCDSSATSMTTSTSMTRKKQVRFCEANDLELLREVVARNPFKTRRWVEIAGSLPLDCDARRVRERTMLLINYHKGSNAESKKQSGTEEPYGEKEQLLDEAVELLEEEDNTKKQEKDRAKEQEAAGKEIRKRAMETLSRSDEESTPTKRSASKDSILIYLREKTEAENMNKEKEMEIKKKELELKEKEIELQREKINMEKKEREQQSEMMTQLLKALLDRK